MSQFQMNQILPVHTSWSPARDAQPLGPVMVDIAGLTLSDHERTRLQHPLVGAVILFARNFASRAQLTALCDSIHAVRQTPLLIVVDHEGGRVQRFQSDGFTHLPAMRQLGHVYDQNPQQALQVAQAAGLVLASELRSCGVDFSFTPVLDLDYGASSVIGDRALHHDPQRVALLARALIQGLAQGGMAACGKHFPGHGYVQADSHVAIPVDDRPLDEILQTDVLPYQALGSLSLPAIMPAHVIYPQVDSQPAGFSSIWIQHILRQQLGYQGVVFSDDLTMHGASVAGDITQRAQAALQAGCDMVLVCNHPELADELLAHLPLEQAVCERLYALIPTQASLTWEQLQHSVLYQDAKRLLHHHFSA